MNAKYIFKISLRNLFRAITESTVNNNFSLFSGDSFFATHCTNTATIVRWRVTDSSGDKEGVKRHKHDPDESEVDQ